jgi:hypothetical protein
MIMGECVLVCRADHACIDDDVRDELDIMLDAGDAEGPPGNIVKDIGDADGCALTSWG